MAYERFKQSWNLEAVEEMEPLETMRLMQSKKMHKRALKALQTMLPESCTVTLEQAGIFVGTYPALLASEQLIENNGTCRGQVQFFVDTARTVIEAFESEDRATFQENFVLLFAAYETYRQVTTRIGALDFDALPVEQQNDIDRRLQADMQEARAVISQAMESAGPDAHLTDVMNSEGVASNEAVKRLFSEWQFLLGPPSGLPAFD
jgi:hypothetical protein